MDTSDWLKNEQVLKKSDFCFAKTSFETKDSSIKQKKLYKIILMKIIKK